MHDRIDRVLVIGLDGATFDLIRPWGRAGHLPTLANLMENGAQGLLRSVLPPYTAQAWTTMVTGVNAGRHRLYDFWERDSASYGFRLTNASRRGAPAVWTLLSRLGQDVVVMNVPMTYPPEAVKGVMISGRDTPSLNSAFSHPPELKNKVGEWLHAAGKEYVIVPNDWRAMRQGRPDIAVQELLNEVDVRFDVAEHLLKDHAWRFGMFVTSAPDGAAHFFWKFNDPSHPLFTESDHARYGDYLLEIYKRIDLRLAQLLKQVSDDTLVLIVSDHGACAEPDYALHLNLFLAQQGWLAFSNTKTDQATSRLRRGLVLGYKTARNTAKSILPFQFLTRLRRLWPDALRVRVESKVLFGDIDWSHTVAFSEERRGNIWINLKGRDPLGIVEPGAPYEQLRDSIITALGELKHPVSGAPIIRRTWRREELFDGPFVHLLPDLILEGASPAIFKQHASQSQPAVRKMSIGELRALPTSGNHHMDGIFIAYGPGVRAGATILNAQLADIAATALYALNVVPPAQWQGKPLVDAFDPAWVAARSAVNIQQDLSSTLSTTNTSYTDQEAKIIEERLAGLGYME